MAKSKPPLNHALLVCLGQEVRTRRIDAGLTQSQLAAKTGHSSAWMSYVENGTQNMTVLALHGLTQALGTPLSELLECAEKRMAS